MGRDQLSQTTGANGNTFTLQRENVFFNTLPYIGVMFSGKAGTIPDGVRFVGKNNTTGGPTHNLSELYNYDRASFLDGFTVRFTIHEAGWAFQVEGLDIEVAEEGSWPADFALTDVLDGDSFVSAHAQTPGTDLTARYDSCTVWIGKKDASRANTPRPENGADDVSRDVVLAWNSGEFAVTYDVYLGASFDDVNDADVANPMDVLVSSAQDANSYEVARLEFGQTYFWRVDEVNGAPANTTMDFGGAAVRYVKLTVNGAHGAMGKFRLSEVRFLSIPVQADEPQPADGAADIAVADAALSWKAGREVAVHDVYLGADPSVNPGALDLAAMGVNLSSVTSVILGIEGAGASGTVFVDDLRLYPQAAELIEPVTPDDSDPNLAAYYAFEGNTDDSTGNFPGEAVGEPAYTAGKAGQALDLDNEDDHVIYTFDEEVWSAYSVSLWVKTDLFAQDQYSSLLNNNSTSSDFQIDTDGSDPGSYRYLGAASGILGPVSSDWVHLAVSCDGIQTRIYYNGLYVTTVNSADTRFGQIAIGINRGMNNRFGGVIDEVRLYNRALSDAEVLGLAGVTTRFRKRSDSTRDTWFCHSVITKGLWALPAAPFSIH